TGTGKTSIAISGNYLGVSGMSQGWLETVEALSADFVLGHMPEVAQQYTELNPAPMLERFINKTKELWSRDCVIEVKILQTLQAPTLIVGGDRDIVLPEQLVDMKKLIPDASLLMLPYCGHFVFQDFAWSNTTASAVTVFKDFLTTRFSTHNADFF
ncbi:MAG: hypothetical protein QM665_03225, partial [Desulfovibrio sp.]